MKIAIYLLLAATLPMFVWAQVLNGDRRFFPVSQMSWDMGKEKILHVCGANKMHIGGNDSTVTFDARYFDVEAKTIIRFRNKQETPRSIELKFKELTEKLLDTLVSHLTRALGASPIKAEKAKNVLIFTMRMEVAMWKTKTEKIMLVVGKRDKTIFDMYLSIEPLTS